MDSNSETVREVCAEIRIQKYQTALTDRDVVALRDRILAAHERDMAAKDAEIAQLVTECYRLKAALLTICTADKTAEGLRDIAIDACNGKEVK